MGRGSGATTLVARVAAVVAAVNVPGTGTGIGTGTGTPSPSPAATVSISLLAGEDESLSGMTLWK